ncbi:porin family protein [Neisseria dentiae]|uniref:porin family protein n=1 Tax=Neisseria dentiae TaxID=194197 RepID=UPI00211CEC73|nr:porin family protein [Neisseria dentiae]MCQ9326513.1 porin family protein [Neisseria dentiae]
MKKALLTVLALGSAAMVSAQPLSNTFTGPSVEIGAGISKTDLKNSNLKEKNKFDIAIRGNYNVEYGANWIGGIEVAAKPIHVTVGKNAAGKVTQKFDASASYLQGYRFTENAMFYGKVGYHYGKFEGINGHDRRMNGVGYGAGLKYTVTPNVEVGGEWEQTRFKRGSDKATNNSYMATVGYRF